MKLKTKKNVKPWEKVSIDEILPYNPKYTKITALSYVFLAFTILERTNFFGVQENYLSLLELCGYGILASAFLYLFSDGNHKRMLNNFIGITPFFLIFGLIITTILTIVTVKFN